MERVRPSIRADSSERSLKIVDTLRILGVVFDRRLSFFAHADHLKENVNHLVAKVVTFKNMVGLWAEYGGDITPACAQRAMVDGGSDGQTVLGDVSQRREDFSRTTRTPASDNRQHQQSRTLPDPVDSNTSSYGRHKARTEGVARVRSIQLVAYCRLVGWLGLWVIHDDQSCRGRELHDLCAPIHPRLWDPMLGAWR
ncbi:hypothetical protein MRX96_005048 [Rhipicephalus microplus]